QRGCEEHSYTRRHNTEDRVPHSFNLLSVPGAGDPSTLRRRGGISSSPRQGAQLAVNGGRLLENLARGRYGMSLKSANPGLGFRRSANSVALSEDLSHVCFDRTGSATPAPIWPYCAP